MTSHRCGQAIASARNVWELLHRGRVVVTVAAVAIGLSTAQFATAFWQGPGEPSPASGTAQVVAQGVVDIQDGDLRWEITEGSAPPPANATESRSDLGFLIVDSGVLLAENLATGDQHRLPSGEAMLTLVGDEHLRAALGSDPAVYRPATGHWFVRQSTSRFSTWLTYQWGTTGDLPAPADYDGDGRTDIAVWRSSTGVWYISRSAGGSSSPLLGVSSDRPIPKRGP